MLGLDASRHLVSFFEPLLADLGVMRSRDLHRCRSDERVMVAGVKVASQTPAIRSGQRIIFLTLDDATGPVDVTVFESVQPKVAKTVFHSFVLAVVGNRPADRGQGRLGGRRGRVDLTALLHAASAGPASRRRSPTKVPRPVRPCRASSGTRAAARPADDTARPSGAAVRSATMTSARSSRADPARRPRCVLRLRRGAQGPRAFRASPSPWAAPGRAGS